MVTVVGLYLTILQVIFACDSNTKLGHCVIFVGEPGVPTIEEWLLTVLSGNDRAGADDRIMTYG